MKRLLSTAALVGLLVTAGGFSWSADSQPAQRAQASAASLPGNPHSQDLQADWKLLETYCVKCHNATDWAGSIAFDTMQPDTAAA